MGDQYPIGGEEDSLLESECTTEYIQSEVGLDINTEDDAQSGFFPEDAFDKAVHSLITEPSQHLLLSHMVAGNGNEELIGDEIETGVTDVNQVEMEIGRQKNSKCIVANCKAYISEEFPQHKMCELCGFFANEDNQISLEVVSPQKGNLITSQFLALQKKMPDNPVVKLGVSSNVFKQIKNSYHDTGKHPCFIRSQEYVIKSNPKKVIELVERLGHKRVDDVICKEYVAQYKTVKANMKLNAKQRGNGLLGLYLPTKVKSKTGKNYVTYYRRLNTRPRIDTYNKCSRRKTKRLKIDTKGSCHGTRKEMAATIVKLELINHFHELRARKDKRTIDRLQKELKKFKKLERKKNFVRKAQEKMRYHKI